jgi:hypothetical protein
VGLYRQGVTKLNVTEAGRDHFGRAAYVVQDGARSRTATPSPPNRTSRLWLPARAASGRRGSHHDLDFCIPRYM